MADLTFSLTLGPPRGSPRIPPPAARAPAPPDHPRQAPSPAPDSPQAVSSTRGRPPTRWAAQTSACSAPSIWIVE